MQIECISKHTFAKGILFTGWSLYLMCMSLFGVLSYESKYGVITLNVIYADCVYAESMCMAPKLLPFWALPILI